MLVSSSIVTIRSSAGCPASQTAREPSLCSLHSRLRRCAPAFGSLRKTCRGRLRLHPRVAPPEVVAHHCSWKCFTFQPRYAPSQSSSISWASQAGTRLGDGLPFAVLLVVLAIAPELPSRPRLDGVEHEAMLGWSGRRSHGRRDHSGRAAAVRGRWPRCRRDIRKPSRLP